MTQLCPHVITSSYHWAHLPKDVLHPPSSTYHWRLWRHHETKVCHLDGAGVVDQARCVYLHDDEMIMWLVWPDLVIDIARDRFYSWARSMPYVILDTTTNNFPNFSVGANVESFGWQNLWNILSAWCFTAAGEKAKSGQGSGPRYFTTSASLFRPTGDKVRRSWNMFG